MNKIVKNLNSEELEEFIKECAQTPGLTLEKIQGLAKKYGIQISLMSAKNFRDNALKKWRAGLEKAKEVSKQIKDLVESGAVTCFTDASSTVIAQMVFSSLMEGGGNLDLNTLSKIIARLRTGDHRLRELEMKVAEFEQEAAERQAKVDALKAQAAKAKDGGGLTEETLQQIEEAINLL